MADVFISYSSEDKTIVKQLAAMLENRGWSVWWDRQIPIGQKYDTVIENELHKASCVIVVWTKRSIGSEWVKNEASEAAQKGILVPVILEDLTLPLAFKRIESAMLNGWQGEQDHPELGMLFSAVENIIAHAAPDGVDQGVGDKGISGQRENKPVPAIRSHITAYTIVAIAGLLISIALVYYYLTFLQNNTVDEVDRRMFYLVLVLFGISVSALVFGTMNTYALSKGQKQNSKFKMAGPGVGLLLIVLGGFYLPQKATEKTVTVRVFDQKKNPVTQGDVKIYLKEYIRSQSIDKMGQALFTGIPADMAGNNKIKLEVSSPGYATRQFDTMLVNSKLLELTLPLTTVVFISGKIKTAAEIPIKGVEVNVDGTRYYAISITDGSYNLRLEEYTLGDEITLTTSHKDFEDKTISLRINAPEIAKQDIFLNPISH
ncbi:MAG: toll/interleukin-1 receptor domain-containing protein [Ferruginibacter sp.]